MCLRAWKRLHGLGLGTFKTLVVCCQKFGGVVSTLLHFLPGSQRFERLRDAVSTGKAAPPADMRFVKGVPKNASSPAKSAVIAFLESIYSSVAETLPDHRDDPADECTLYSLPMPDVDPLTAAHDAVGQHHVEMTKEAPLPRVKKKSITVNPARAHLEVRFLPPGKMVDYYEQFKAIAKDSSELCTFTSFWRIWLEEFNHLRFRSSSSHAVCTVCMRHKMMISQLSGHMAAREKQVQLFSEHLKSQYADRTVYWGARGISRLRNHCEVTCIIDSMDQQKFSYPRSQIYKSKELSTFIRPRAHITALLMHGHFVLVTVAEHNCPKNANFMTEILAYGLTLLRKKGVDTSRLFFRVHSDNTVRECKNNILMSWMGSLVGRGLIAGGALACLRSGHSHEDVDQCFGSLAAHIARKGRYARHTNDFVNLIRQWLHSLKRPYEVDRYCIKLDQIRDWKLGEALGGYLLAF